VKSVNICLSLLFHMVALVWLTAGNAPLF